MKERLQKILARAGYGSRRDCEQFISAGRVRVNGKVAQLGDQAAPLTDRISLDGRAVSSPQAPVYVLLHKPRNVLSAVSTHDGRKTVRDLIPIPEAIYPVGRLDFDSEGLLLLTNDGELANRLTHPRYEHDKEYRVLVARHPDDEQLRNWRRGIVLEDGFHTAPLQVRVDGFSGKGAWLRVVMREGHKRQIREMGRQTGLPVVRIVRVRMGTLQLGSLKSGQWRYLTQQELEALKGLVKTGGQKDKPGGKT